MVLGLMLLFSACTHEPIAPPSPDPEQIPEAPYSKEIILVDSLRENQITLRCSSNNAGFLDGLTAKNFVFKAVQEMPDTSQQNVAATGMTPPDPSEGTTALQFEVIAAELKPDMKAVSLQYKQGEGASDRSPVDLLYNSDGWLLGLQGIMAFGLPFYTEGWYSGGFKYWEPGWTVFTADGNWFGPRLSLHITNVTLISPVVIFLP